MTYNVLIGRWTLLTHSLTCDYTLPMRGSRKCSNDSLLCTRQS